MTFRAFLIWILIPSVLVLLATVAVSFFLIVPISMLTRDPLAVTGGHPFFGAISNIGALLWSFTVAICFFSSKLLKEKNESAVEHRFLLYGGLVSLMLLIDDLFMLHDRIFPRYFNLSEEVTFAVYGILTLIFLFNFRNFISKTSFFILFLSAGFFITSLLVDFFLTGYFQIWHHLFEDGPKFLGIACWFGYFFSVCSQEIKLVIDKNTSGFK